MNVNSNQKSLKKDGAAALAVISAACDGVAQKPDKPAFRPVPYKVLTDISQFVPRDRKVQLNTEYGAPANWKPDVVFGVGRWSNPEQAEKTSEGRQVFRISDFCEQMVYPKPMWVFDDGVSAWDPNFNNLCPGSNFGDLLAKIKQSGRPSKNILFVWDDPDRFSRQPLDKADSELMALLRKGYYVFFTTLGLMLQPEDKDCFIKRMVVLAALHRAHAECDRKSDAIRASFEERIKEALKGRKVSFGGNMINWVIWVGKEQDYDCHPDRWTVMERIVRDVFAFKRVGQIAAELDKEKTPTFEGGKHWRGGTIKTMLKSPAIKGTIRILDYEIPGYIPALLNDEQWDRLQAMLLPKLRRDGKPRKGGGCSNDKFIRNLFPGRVYCFHCEQSMKVRAVSPSIPQMIYVCSGHEDSFTSNGTLCLERRDVVVDAVELDFHLFVLKTLPSDLFAKCNDNEEVRIELQKQIAKALQRQENLADLYAENKDATTKKKYSEAKAIYDRLNAKLDAVSINITGESITDSVAWRELVDDIRSAIGDQEVSEVMDFVLKFKAQLADQDFRKRSVERFKQLVNEVKIYRADRTKYMVQFKGGTWSEWRDITLLERGLRLELIEASLERRSVHFKKPHSQEHNDKIRKGRTAAWVRIHEAAKRGDKEAIEAIQRRANKISVSNKAFRQKLAASETPEQSKARKDQTAKSVSKYYEKMKDNPSEAELARRAKLAALAKAQWSKAKTEGRSEL